MRVAAAAALLLAPAIAEAAEGFATANVNMRAGPSTQYPAVTVIPAGESVEIHGCLADVPWCDVEFYGGRGWVAGRYVQALYQSRRVYVGPEYYRPLGIPTVVFSVGNDWDHYYRNRDFYRDRDRWRRNPVYDRPPAVVRPVRPPEFDRNPTAGRPRPDFDRGPDLWPEFGRGPDRRPDGSRRPDRRPEQGSSPARQPDFDRGPGRQDFQGRPNDNRRDFRRPPQRNDDANQRRGGDGRRRPPPCQPHDPACGNQQ
ncbi:SH3 domain-containing protein [Rhizobium sp. LjRoot258]